MGKVLLYIAQSLDGFISDEKGGVDWLNKYLKPDEDYGYKDFYQSLGAVILGSNTYKDALRFNYWYEGVEGYVFTNRSLEVPDGWNPIFCKGDPTPLVEALRLRPQNTWLVGGAQMVSTFINARLVDELILSIIPEIITRGIPLFQNIQFSQKLKLMENRGFKYGVLQLRYGFS